MDPPVCVWNLSQQDLSEAPYSSLIISAQILLAARNFATSSNRSLCAAKKKERRGANSSIFIPRVICLSTYSMPLAIVNAISCAAVDPASRIWYPEIDMGFQLGSSSAQKLVRSATSLKLSSTGKIYVPLAIYSLRMSF